MAESIQLGITVDTDTRATRQEFSALRREVKREADAMGGDWEAAAERVEDALREAGARDDLIDAARRIGSEGPTEIEKMRTALRDTGDEARTLGDDIDDAAQGIRDSFEENALTADDVFGAELKAELVANMVETGSEVIRGFKDGFDSEDASTILDGLTDTLVSAGAIGGPLGAAAALAGGAAIQAFAGPFLEDAEKTAEQAEETFSAAFSNIVENGAEMGRELTIAASVAEFAQDADRMNTVTETANKLGVERGIVLRAMAGDQDALNVLTERHADLQQQQADAAQFASDQMLANGSVTEETADMVNDLNQQLAGSDELLGKVTGSYETNTDALNAASDAASAKAEADAWATEKATQHAQALAKSTGQAQDFTVTINGATETLRAMPNGKVVKVTDSGTAKLTQQEINAIHGGEATVRVRADTSEAQEALAQLRIEAGRGIPVRYRRVGGPTP